MAISFDAQAKAGDALVVGTDGLWKHASRMSVRELLGRQPSPRECADALVDLTRRAAGNLQDDVALVVCGWSVR
jgi:serine/threonine protein phosphatase PrpC